MKKSNPELNVLKKKSTFLRVTSMILCDLLLIGVTLCSFAFFHHVLPAIRSQRESQKLQEQTPQTRPSVPPFTTAPTTTAQDSTTAPTVTEIPETEATEPTEPKTEWQIKFADKFTDEVVVTPTSYTSPYVSVNIETVSYGSEWGAITYHVADIYVASLDNFKTHTANNEMRYFSTQNVLSMDADSNAILAVGGDFYAYQYSGFLMRNGYLYKNDIPYCDICVLYDNGVLATYPPYGYDAQEVLDNGAVQIWNFGPSLLDENGKALERFDDVDSHVAGTHPRSVIGYYEPGHYCLVVVDGRAYDYAVGMDLYDLAALLEDLGCKVAYNLDGGGSAVMTFDDTLYSVPSEERELSDIVIVVDGPPAQQEE